MTVQPAPPEDGDDMLAAEYVLRLLSGEDLATAERRLRDDPVFAQAVAEWEARLAPLGEALPDERPRPAAKQALFARLFPDSAPAPRRAAFWRGARPWQALGALCLLLAVGVGLVALDPAVRSAGPLYTAEIAAEAGDFRVVAVVDKTVDEVFLTRTAGAAPEGRILQVWAHGEGEPAISVGLWPAGDTVRLPLPPAIAAVQGVLTLGVSEEPPGGSPTGSPSGRVFGTVDIPDVTPATF